MFYHLSLSFGGKCAEIFLFGKLKSVVSLQNFPYLYKFRPRQICASYVYFSETVFPGNFPYSIYPKYVRVPYCSIEVEKRRLLSLQKILVSYFRGTGVLFKIIFYEIMYRQERAAENINR